MFFYISQAMLAQQGGILLSHLTLTFILWSRRFSISELALLRLC